MFESTELADAVATLRRAAAPGAGAAGATVGPDCEVLALLGELRNLAEVLTATCLREVDLRGSTETIHGLKARRWFSITSKCAGGTAARLHQLGGILADFPQLAAAAHHGRVGVDHLDALRRACNPRTRAELIGLDQELCELACRFEVREFTRALARIVAMIDLDGPAPDCRDTDTLTVAADLAGGVHLEGTLTGEHAVRFTHALNTELGRQRRPARTDTAAGIPMPSTAVLRARALIALVCRGHAAMNTPAARTDAIVVIETDTALPAPNSDGPTSDGLGGDDPRGAPPVVRTLDGDPIDPITAAVMLCDANLTALACDQHGRPLRYGRTRRFATPHQTHALAIRDRGCIFPGCDAPPSHCHAHHEPAWHHGGRTDIGHMALLCPYHHGRIHGPDWQLHPAPARTGHHHTLTNTRTGQQFHIGPSHPPGDPPDP